MKLIIDAESGTIVSVENCYIVDTEQLSDIENSELEDGSDTQITDIALRHGYSVHRMCRDTGWGDNSYRHTVSYSPLSIKDEADSLLEDGIYESPEDEKYKQVLEWARTATTEDLAAVSNFAMSNDHVWDGFRDNLMEALIFVYNELHP